MCLRGYALLQSPLNRHLLSYLQSTPLLITDQIRLNRTNYNLSSVVTSLQG